MVTLGPILEVTSLIFASITFSVSNALGLLLLIYLLYTRFAFISLLYFAWMIYDRETPWKGGRNRRWTRYFRNWKIWTYYTSYFPLHLHKTAELELQKNYIIGFHPHGVAATSALAGIGTNGAGVDSLYPDIRFYGVGLNLVFWLPIGREFFMSYNMCSADKSSLDYLLTQKGKGNAVLISVGGMAEAMDTLPNALTLTLKKRKGFIKLALEHGASLVPCICFGENDLYHMVHFDDSSFIARAQKRLQKIVSMPLLFCYGRGIFENTFGLLPLRKPLDVVVGKPLDVPQNANPSLEDVEKLHQEYTRALSDLFDQYKAKYASDPSLKIVFR